MNLPPLFSQRTLIVAFEGWNDAGEAASAAVKHLIELTKAEAVVSIDPEEYCEFHYARPQVYFDESGDRQIRWPATEFLIADETSANPDLRQLHFMLGVEPAFRWRSFAAEVLEIIEDRNINSVIFVGAMLADVPHTRPVVVTASSQSEAVRLELGIEKSDYSGPVGILTVIAQMLETSGIPCVSVWAQVPHYVHNSPSPKVTLAILSQLEKLLAITVDHGNLATEAFEWERGIDEIAEADEEMGGYITQLEKEHEENEAKAREIKNTEGSGDVLAEEFEKFLAENASKPDEEN